MGNIIHETHIFVLATPVAVLTGATFAGRPGSARKWYILTRCVESIYCNYDTEMLRTTAIRLPTRQLTVGALHLRGVASTASRATLPLRHTGVTTQGE